MSRLISFDLGVHLGWAVLDDGHRVASGTTYVSPTRRAGQRWHLLAAAFERVFETYPGATRIVYEKVRRHIGGDSAHCYGAIESLLQTTTFLLELPEPEPVEIPVWKSHVCGNGRALKPDYVRCVNEHFDLKLHEKKNEDEAAALGVGLAAFNLGDGISAKRRAKKRKKLLKKLQKKVRKA